MDVQTLSSTVVNGATMTSQMLPPPPGKFVDREELIRHVGDFAVSQGYVVTIRQSKRDRYVILSCDRGGVYRSRRKAGDDSSSEPPPSRKRKVNTRLTNCPFEAVGKKDDGLWILSIKNGTHNHEPLKDLSEHPSSRRFSENEVMLIKDMTEAGLKPRQILKRLRQSNPDLLSTPKHVYNVKAKIRQGILTVKNIKSLQREKGSDGNNCLTINEPPWRQHSPARVPNLIGGKFIDSQSFEWIDILNPATQHIISQAPITTNEEFKAAVFSAKRAFSCWHDTPTATRRRIMFKFQEIIHRDIENITSIITAEHGKALKDSHIEVLRGLEAIEHAFGLGISQTGEFVLNSSNGIDTYNIREPLGVCAGICHSDFPALNFLRMFPIAIMCGNTFILKAPEKNPGVSVILAEMAMEAGLPNGVLNIVHGRNDIINAICDDDDIKAVSFVGSNALAAYVYARASARGKHVQANIVAKNHAVVMPDAIIDTTLNALVAAGFGTGGQKCTELSAAIFVGGFAQWEDKLVERARLLKVHVGTDPVTDLGPVFSQEAKEQILQLILRGVECGAKLVLDGRNLVVPGFEHGNFIGPTILCDVTVDMACYKEEIVGPVLLCIQANSIEEAIHIVNKNRYGNGASIFTTSSVTARKFQTEVEVAHVGINVPISVPLPFSAYASSRHAFVCDLNYDSKAGVNFYTQIKTVTQQWKDLTSVDGLSMEMADPYRR